MNILVIGNGFDLAHGLPTTYKDFLNFTDSYKSYDSFIDDELLREAKKLIEGNSWIRFFKNFYFGSGWIDFEREISNVIKMIDKKGAELEPLKEKKVSYVRIHQYEQKSLRFFDAGIKDGIISDENFISGINGSMQRDLNNLIRCLEIYLDAYVNKLSVDFLSPDIQQLTIDKVLSFNYTNTFVRLYNLSGSNDIEYDYIHGKADIHNTIETNNMVLGIDEYLSDDRKSKDVEFISFKKYYQRIYKETGCKYKEWIHGIQKEYHLSLKNESEMLQLFKQAYNQKDSESMWLWYLASLNNNQRKDEKHNLYIFGHSLDITDKDILRDLILNDNVHTTIFHHNKEVMGQQIANLVKVIRQDELIRRTGGNTKTIEFRPQQPMVPVKSFC